MLHSAVKELIPVPTASAHASCIARVSGETWLTWFGGTREGDNDVKIYLSRKTASGWTEPVRICADESLPHWNPVLFPRESGADLFFKVGATIPGWKTMRVHINEQGQPEGDIRELVPGDAGGRGPVRNKCLTLRNGLVLAPTSIETAEAQPWKDACAAPCLTGTPEKDDPLRWKPFIDISRDGGDTFTQAAPIPLLADKGASSLRPAQTAQTDRISGRSLFPCHVRKLGAIQPALWQSDDGSVHALMRSSEGFILRSDSPDGVHWSPAGCTSLPNNNSGIDLIRLDDGRILLCLNPVSGDWAARSPLSLYISDDDGDTFRPLMTLEMNEGEYSYPSLACEGNTVYLSYTWKRLQIAVWTIDLEPRA